jgi:hypothetical protein
MLHACLCTICFVFCYTSWRFYVFSGTNLLTRCHSASFLFFVIFMFQKSYIENILRIARNKSRSSYFFWHETESKAETEESQEPATPWGGAASPWPTSWRCPSAYIFSLTRKPKGPDQFSSKHTASCRHRRRKIGRVQKLFSASCQRGESPPEAFFIIMLTSGVMRE